MSEIEIVKRVVSEFFNKEYKCEIVDQCIGDFIGDLDNAIKKSTNNVCFIEYASDYYIVVVCNLFDKIHIELDYDIIEIVTVKPRVTRVKIF
ncbi:MAG: hypothetical protein ACO2OR_04310 [Desulfurococcaceae archaeon]